MNRRVWNIGAVVAALAGLATPVTLAHDTGPVTVPLRIVESFPVITARIEGREVALMYDLGSDARLALPGESLAAITTWSAKRFSAATSLCSTMQASA